MTKVFPMMVRRADKRPPPEVQHDAHLADWLVYGAPKRPPLEAWTRLSSARAVPARTAPRIVRVMCTIEAEKRKIRQKA